ncbi:hypothetical protein ACIBCT_07535 [Streptosporangium sp. NPDC050855]|uniref:hypothetical protein n=1 Tax=Streptosporangium sp. NPDC050855 TaxID=3366194 RepID=UPI00379D834D
METPVPAEPVREHETAREPVHAPETGCWGEPAGGHGPAGGPGTGHGPAGGPDVPHEPEREHGSHIITVLEGAWATVRARHPDVPRVVMITGQGREGRWMNWGHFGPDTWTAQSGSSPELFASGELIGLGGRHVMQALLHEAAHALAHVRGIKETSNGYRYHNKRFVRLAAELGLAGPDRPAPITGYSDCTITDATAESYRAQIDALDAERLPYLDSPQRARLRPSESDQGTAVTAPLPVPGDAPQEAPGREPRGRDGTRFAVTCCCIPARRLQVTPAVWERGSIVCGTCGEEFAPPE